MFTEFELSYLTHLVFRVLYKGPRRDRDSTPASYVVQVLVSPGIDHHSLLCRAANGQLDGTLHEGLSAAQEPLLASSDDLTLEQMDRFLTHVLCLE